MRIRLLFLLGCLSALAQAAPDCGQGAAFLLDAPDMGPRHHPIGRPLPAGRDFNQPDGCIDGVWLFDGDRNRQADPGEIRLYGPQRAIVCASCHGDSPDRKSAASASVFLRQDASTLCLVCHNL
jgi:hypothetical protein